MRIVNVAPFLAAFALSLSAGAALAQSFTGAGPMAPFTLPAGADPRADRGAARTDPAVAGAASRPEPRPPEAPAMRHLHGTLQGFRLFGEIGASEWPIYLTEAQARGKLRFKVGYLSAVSAAPEASKLSLVINGKAVGETAIRAPNSVKVVEFDIPEGLLKAGFNAVRLTAEQRHRVDCSPDATYELWTQIDPSQTGLVMPEAVSGVTQLSDLAALWPDADGALPIRAVLASKTRPANVERIIRAAQVIALAGRFEQPVIDVGPPAGGGGGVNLAVGTAAEIGGIRGLDAVGPVAGPKVLVLPAAPGRRVTVVATGTNDAEVDQAVAQLAAAVKAEPRGTPEGLRAAAAFPGYRVEGGERVRLRDLGLVSQEFSGHFFRIGFNVIMPPDFLPADYAKVMLDLAGGYAPGLAKDAQVVDSINGRSVASARLPKSAGDVFRQNQIPLPLSYWRPGLNRVEIGAKVPVPSDAVCDPIATIVGKKRFLFLDSTELVLPPLARIARMPNLSVTASGGLPYTAGRGRSKLFMPLPDKDTVAAAATLATRMAVAAGRPIDFEFTTARPATASGAGPAPT